MELTVQRYLALLALVCAGRAVELALSRRNVRRLAQAGALKSRDRGYKWMVAFHASVLLGSGAETVLLNRPWIPGLGFPMLGVFLAANAARWWVMHTLGTRWNVAVMSASGFGVITSRGPYRWVRHPNYTAVFVEMAALPLMHACWATAMFGGLAHVFVLRYRVRLEESVLEQDPAWKSAFATRPRFVPRWL